MTNRLYYIFFLSGAAALTFETLWFRLSELVFGNSVWSAAIVLSGFMAGLALGNYLVTIYGERIKNTIYFYAILEMIIGLTGTILVIILPRLPHILTPLFELLYEQQYILNLSRIIIIFLLLLVPTTAMGATLPIMVKSFKKFNPNFGSTLGVLYGINTLGAVTGVLLCEIFFIKYFGIKNSGLIATSVNLIAAYLALRIAITTGESGLKFDLIPGFGRKFIFETSSLKVYFIAAFLSGFILLSLELVWFRYLLFFKFGTSLIFSIMLAIVLLGISLGGFTASNIYKKEIKLTKYIMQLALLSGILTLLNYMLFYKFYKGITSLNLNMFSSYYNELLEFIIYSIFLMLPVALISGMLFTMLGTAIKSQRKEDTEAAGLLTLANTTGAATGALIAGFLLLPLAGMEKSFYIMGLGYGLIAILIYIYTERIKSVFFSPAGLVIYTYILLLIVYPSGKTSEIIKDRYPKSKVIAIHEGQVATNVYIQYEKYNKPLYQRLVTNNHSMSGNNTAGKRYMQLFVYLPMALHNDIKEALLISYGLGNTAKALINIPGIETIDIVDISKDVFEMSKLIYPESENPVTDKRVNIHIDDGRHFLLTKGNKYDLITAEPPPPAGAHVVNLYSQEYFQLIYENLKEGGITTYWLPTHLLKVEDTESIIKAFCNVFSDCTLWTGSALDWMLTGTRNLDNNITDQHFNLLWQEKELAEELNTLGFENPYQLGATFIADAQFLKKLTLHSQPVTDNFPQRISPVADYNIKNKYIYFNLMNENDSRERFIKSDFINKYWPPLIKEKTLDYFQYQKSITNYLDSEYKTKFDNDLVYLHNLLTNTSLETLPLWVLGSSKEEQEIINSLIDEQGYSEKYSIDLAKKAISKRSYQDALNYLEEHLQSEKYGTDPAIITLYIYMLCMTGKTSEVLNYLNEISSHFNPNENNINFIIWLNEQFNMDIPPHLLH